jgi:hypothetical protein
MQNVDVKLGTRQSPLWKRRNMPLGRSVRRAIGRLLLHASIRIRRSPHQGSPGPLALFEPDHKSRTALVVHLDATEKSVMALIEDTQGLRSVFHRVVYVTDFADPSMFLQFGGIFEYMPSINEQVRHAHSAPWCTFLSDRYNLLIARWTPWAIVAFGTSFETWLNRIAAEEKARLVESSG